ncbi:hypothetical protein B0H11DRAFT_360606 [Mycena galericulata]|nr:hypothetical protein B0H11DRAFT_360606 [Mycena galericulata]
MCCAQVKQSLFDTKAVFWAAWERSCVIAGSNATTLFVQLYEDSLGAITDPPCTAICHVFRSCSFSDTPPHPTHPYSTHPSTLVTLSPRSRSSALQQHMAFSNPFHFQRPCPRASSPSSGYYWKVFCSATDSFGSMNFQSVDPDLAAIHAARNQNNAVLRLIFGLSISEVFCHLSSYSQVYCLHDLCLCSTRVFRASTEKITIPLVIGSSGSPGFAIGLYHCSCLCAIIPLIPNSKLASRH